jgi:hypothetical protein
MPVPESPEHMPKQFDLESHRLEQVLRRAQRRLAWMNRSVLDAAALTAVADLCDKASEDLEAHKTNTGSTATERPDYGPSAKPSGLPCRSGP